MSGSHSKGDGTNNSAHGGADSNSRSRSIIPQAMGNGRISPRRSRSAEPMAIPVREVTLDQSKSAGSSYTDQRSLMTSVPFLPDELEQKLKDQKLQGLSDLDREFIQTKENIAEGTVVQAMKKNNVTLSPQDALGSVNHIVKEATEVFSWQKRKGSALIPDSYNNVIVVYKGKLFQAQRSAIHKSVNYGCLPERFFHAQSFDEVLSGSMAGFLISGSNKSKSKPKNANADMKIDSKADVKMADVKKDSDAIKNSRFIYPLCPKLGIKESDPVEFEKNFNVRIAAIKADIAEAKRLGAKEFWIYLGRSSDPDDARLDDGVVQGINGHDEARIRKLFESDSFVTVMTYQEWEKKPVFVEAEKTLKKIIANDAPYRDTISADACSYIVRKDKQQLATMIVGGANPSVRVRDAKQSTALPLPSPQPSQILETLAAGATAQFFTTCNDPKLGGQFLTNIAAALVVAQGASNPVVQPANLPSTTANNRYRTFNNNPRATGGNTTPPPGTTPANPRISPTRG